MGAQQQLPPARGARGRDGADMPRRGRNNNPRFTGLVNRAKELRKGLPSRKKESNVATSDYDVRDRTGRSHRGSIDSVSGKKTYDEKGFTRLRRDGRDALPSRQARGHNRDYDSEKKIYEDFSRRFPDPQTGGRITIYTERHPCQGCAQSTQDFLRRYPNMQVDIVYTHREGPGTLRPGAQNNFSPDSVNNRIRVHRYF
ncbi:deaminase domain-containing protein [Thermomonospora umbrina]|nr:deaminase domain-containing protein [Thermomonospora umbrina]